MTSIRAIGEVGLIERVRRRMGRRPSVQVGIGDDAAVLRPRLWRGGRLLFASDMLIEGVHFRRRETPAHRIGWKALAANISDIAAMGGEPLWAVVSLGLPPATPVRFVDGLYAGLERCARRFGVSVVGGDTVRAPQVVVDVAILGRVEARHLALRSGARVGDVLFVTGRLGGSLAGGRHAKFLPRVAEARELVKRLPVHAMMDLSDGLASDLWQMSRASGVTLRVEGARIPPSRWAARCRRGGCGCRAWGGERALYHALMDGEDFELLFAVGSGSARRVPARLGRCPVSRIGRVAGRGVNVEMEQPDGRVSRLVPEGFRHF